MVTARTVVVMAYGVMALSAQVMVFGTLLYYNVIKFPCCDGESAVR